MMDRGYHACCVASNKRMIIVGGVTLNQTRAITPLHDKFVVDTG